MKKLTASVCTLAIAALLGSSLSFAEDHGHGDEYQRDQQPERQWSGQRSDRHDERRDERYFDQREGRWNDRRPEYNARSPAFHQGGYIAHEYRSRAYEVDYREHRLSRPPEGHRWVQVGADYVLIAVATGLIANIILNH